MSGKTGKMSCRLCFNMISDGSFKVIDEIIKEAVEVLLPNRIRKVDLEEENLSVMCNGCSTKLLAAFQFKAACMNTEDRISPYVNLKNATPVDLREIYTKERGKVHLSPVLEDERICRLCMQIITCGYTPAEEVKSNMIREYIPQVNFGFTKEPVICAVCLESLETHVSFLNNYRDVEEEKLINIYSDEAIYSPLFIKNEEFDIKYEEIDDASDESVDCPNGSGSGDVETARNDHALQFKDRCHSLNGSHHLKTRGLAALPNLSRYKDGNPPRRTMYECDACNYKSNKWGNLKRHQLVHRDISEVPVYLCGNCNFRSKRRENLAQHQLKHTDGYSYKCGICDFETKTENSFKSHQLRHEVSSKAQRYKYDSYNFQTNQERSREVDHLTRMVPLEVSYVCSACDFRTKCKEDIAMHQLRHEDRLKVKTYKCDSCGFKSRHEKCLTDHRVVHGDPLDLHPYKCESCNFKTEHKHGLKLHQRTHKEASEITYKCNLCIYESIYKANVTRHQLVEHKDPSKIQSY